VTLFQVEVVLGPTVSRPVHLRVWLPGGTYEQIFITVGYLRSLCCGAPSLTRALVCNVLAQFAVILRFKSRRTHEHILLSHLRTLGSHFVAFYGSQGYGGGIITRLLAAMQWFILIVISRDRPRRKHLFCSSNVGRVIVAANA
jgi:hypothetical protein